MKLVSLFSCGGIGDYGFSKAGFEPVLLSDLDERRLSFAKNLLPKTNTIVGDIREVKKEVIDEIIYTIGDEDFALSFTPPCQGMSKNGIKTILKYTHSGARPEVDSRNYLLMPCLEIIEQTKPAVVFFENVTEAKDTMLLINNEPVEFIKYLIKNMENMGYTCEVAEVDFKDYGVPQSRKRLFGVFSRANLGMNKLLRNKTQIPVSLRESIANLPPLDAKDRIRASSPGFHQLHRVPIMRPLLYKWVASTLEGRSALENNLCLSCSHVNRSECLYCSVCESLLSKPYVVRNGSKVLIKGYNSSYRRQRWDRPGNTVTTRSAYASSAYNLHPTQNRVLSIYECAILQGLKPEEIDWTESRTGKLFPDFLLRDVLGEAIPATFTQIIGERVLSQLNVNSAIELELSEAVATS